jgi:hypothetical protein
VVPEQAALVRRIFQEYSDGASYKKITHALNGEGVVSPGGKTWDVSAVRNILHNESYRGYRVWNQTRRNKKVQKGTKTSKPREEWIIQKGAHEVIVDDDLWERVQAKLAGNLRRTKNGRGTLWTPRSPHLLTGLLRCKECGANFHMNTIKARGTVRQYYRCGYHSKRGNAVCANSRCVKRESIEGEVLDLLREQLLIPETVHALLDDVRAHLRDPEKRYSEQTEVSRQADAAVSEGDREPHTSDQRRRANGGPGQGAQSL